MATASRTSLAAQINRLLILQHGADAMEDHMKILGDVVEADACAILFIHPGEGTSRIIAGRGLLTPEITWQAPLETPFLVDQVAGASDVLVRTANAPFHEDPFLTSEEVTSMLFRLLSLGEGYLVTTSFKRVQKTFTPTEIEKFEAVAGVVNLVRLLQHFPREDDILKGTDELTGLGLFADFHQSMVKELSRARRSSGTVTMGIMSIDSPDHHLKKDTVLEVARAFQSQLRNFDTLDRYGSSELAFVLPDLRSAESVRVLERIIKETVSVLDVKTHVPDIYVGLSCYPEDGATFERLIEMAEAAMNKAVDGSTPGVFRWTENGDQ